MKQLIVHNHLRRARDFYPRQNLAQYSTAELKDMLAQYKEGKLSYDLYIQIRAEIQRREFYRGG